MEQRNRERFFGGGSSLVREAVHLAEQAAPIVCRSRSAEPLERVSLHTHLRSKPVEYIAVSKRRTKSVTGGPFKFYHLATPTRSPEARKENPKKKSRLLPRERAGRGWIPGYLHLAVRCRRRSSSFFYIFLLITPVRRCCPFFLQVASSAQAAARRKRLDEIRGNPRPRFGYDPWQHPDLPERGGIQQGVFGGVVAGGSDWGVVKPVLRNGGEHFLQAKVGMKSRVVWST